MKTQYTKRAEAAARQEAYAGLSTEEKYTSLDRRNGKGVGARKERRKLLLKLGWTQQMINLEFPAIKK